MEKELYLKCNKCLINIDINKINSNFVCPNCNNEINLNSLKDNVLKFDQNDLEEIIRNSKTYVINYSQDKFKDIIKKELKNKLLIPEKFSNLKKIETEEINIKYLPFLVYNASVLVIDDGKKNIFEVNNLVIDEFTNYSSLLLDSLYPLDFDSKTIDVAASEIKDLKIDINIFNKKIESIQEELNIKIKSMINNKFSDIFVIKEKYDCILLPIYDYVVKYKNKDYHIIMNANTGKHNIQIPINYTKVSLMIFIFLLIDITFFYLSRLIRIADSTTIKISIFLFILQVLLIWSSYFSSKINSNIYENKNKYKLNKL